MSFIERHIILGQSVYTHFFEGFCAPLRNFGFKNDTIVHYIVFQDSVPGVYTYTVEGLNNMLNMSIKPRNRIANIADEQIIYYI